MPAENRDHLGADARQTFIVIASPAGEQQEVAGDGLLKHLVQTVEVLATVS
jgi:hypothetical protein